MRYRHLLIILAILTIIFGWEILIVLYQKKLLGLETIVIGGIALTFGVIRILYRKIKNIGKNYDEIKRWVDEHEKNDLNEGFENLLRADNFRFRTMAIEHLKGYGLDKLWIEYNSIRWNHTNIQESIEKMIESRIPSELTKVDMKSDSLPDCYDLYQMAFFVYKAIQLKRDGTPKDFFKKTFNESMGCFEIINPVVGLLYARMVRENLATTFMEIITECVNSNEIDTQFDLCDEEEQKKKEIRRQLDKEINKIKEESQKHIPIKGTCERCKDWHEQLDYL